MNSKDIIIFDNYYDTERENELRQFMFENCDEEWTSPEAIPDEAVQSEMYEQTCDIWEYVLDCLEELFGKGCCLITGQFGSWRGKLDGGKFINNIDEFLDVIDHLDYIKIIDRNGHLIIEGSHHDGSDRYELKKLTRKGYELADKNYFANDRSLHNTIMKTNFYSALPHVARTLYGYAV